MELIANAEQLIGPNKERIISLRGYKIPAIENLGATNDLYDIIDLTDNDLLRLDNFPPLKRLETLMVANNRISRVSPEIFDYMPNLKSLLLTQNRISTLADLVPLFKANQLERLSIVDNPVTVKHYYRCFIIYHLPKLRFLDFQHVKDAERQSAKEFFSGDAGNAILKQLGTRTAEELSAALSAESATRATLQVNDAGRDSAARKQQVSDALARPTTTARLTDEQVIQLQEAIAAASTLAEVQMLEEALKSGVLPQHCLLQKSTDTAANPSDDMDI